MNEEKRPKVGAPKKLQVKKKISLTLPNADIEAAQKLGAEKFNGASISEVVSKAMQLLIEQDAKEPPSRPLRTARRTVKAKSSNTPRG